MNNMTQKTSRAQAGNEQWLAGSEPAFRPGQVLAKTAAIHLTSSHDGLGFICCILALYLDLSTPASWPPRQTRRLSTPLRGPPTAPRWSGRHRAARPAPPHSPPSGMPFRAPCPRTASRARTSAEHHSAVSTSISPPLRSGRATRRERVVTPIVYPPIAWPCLSRTPFSPSVQTRM